MANIGVSHSTDISASFPGLVLPAGGFCGAIAHCSLYLTYLQIREALFEAIPDKAGLSCCLLRHIHLEAP